MATFERTHDEHDCVLTCGLSTIGFRLQVFQSPSVPAVVLATQRVVGDGVSLTNAAECWTGHVLTSVLPGGSDAPTWVRHYTEGPVQWAVAAPGPGAVAGDGLRWVPTTRSAVDGLVGSPVDAGRGDVPEPEQEEYDRRMRFVRVSTLPQSACFRHEGCMPGTKDHPEVWWRRRVLRRTGRCCWYHRGDWARVSRDLIELATQIGIDPDEDVVGDDVDRLRVAVFASGQGSRWRTEAMVSLIQDPMALSSGAAPKWWNGQHRGQALRDSGALYALVEVSEG